MKNTITRTIALLSCLLYLWIGISFAEVVLKNTNLNPQYWQYNAIGIFLEYANAN